MHQSTNGQNIKTAVHEMKPNAAIKARVSAPSGGLFVTVRHFAKSAGCLAKTNTLNAHGIAHFGEAMQPRLASIKPKKLSILSNLLTVRSRCLEIPDHAFTQ